MSGNTHFIAPVIFRDFRDNGLRVFGSDKRMDLSRQQLRRHRQVISLYFFPFPVPVKLYNRLIIETDLFSHKRILIRQ